MKKILFLLFCFGFISPVDAQLFFAAKAVPENTKAGTMYVVMKDTSADSVQAFKKVILETWKYCKVSFINKDSIVSTLAPGNSYLSVESMVGAQIGVMFFLYYWTPTEKTLDKAKYKLDPDDIGKQVHAYIHLSFDKFTRYKTKLLENYNFDYTDHAANWSPGLLKNYLQFLQTNMNTEYYMKTGLKEFSKKNDLQKLKTDTLFIPEHSFKFIDHLGYSKKPFMIVDTNEILNEYRYPIKYISENELSEKILNGGIFYYLSCIPVADSNKRINVINASDGTIIYSDYAAGYKLNNGDLKDIAKEIDD